MSPDVAMQTSSCTDSYKSAQELCLFSPSKVNLFFRVLRKRDDGYHEIASLYQAISLGDTMTLSRSEKSSTLTCTDPDLVCDESNLVMKALRLFQSKTKIFDSVSIHLEKKVPMQAGLGGGSGNAATTLWGLSKLFEKKLSLQELKTWSTELGSDVPFFFSHGSAYCTGRGEIMTEVNPIVRNQKVLIVKPKEGLSTPLVYRNTHPELLERRDPMVSLQRFLSETGEYYNDLELAAFTVMPELKAMKQQLMALGFSHVVMSGSGTSFFCIGDGIRPLRPEWSCYDVEFIYRTDLGWYEFG